MSLPLDASATPDPDITGTSATPCHVAIIMDGNGRWAKARGLPRTEGHRRGVEAVRRAIRHAADIGVSYLTLFSFSSENWARPASEVADLLGLLRLFIRSDLAELKANNVRVRIIGERDSLRPDLCKLLKDAEDGTRDNTGLTLVVAFNYGARDEIARAARKLAEAVANGALSPDEITIDAVSDALDTAKIPDPDLIIRTSGEQRLSNFLLWQAAYAEFVFVPVLWPDFDAAAFDAAIADFMNRERRFGRVDGRATV